MIEIGNKQNCCGCAVCTQACPKHCITMVEDAEGFLYPDVELEKCVDCNMCQRVCPMLNKTDEDAPYTKAYAAYNLDEKERLQSSSGGVFSLLAKQVLREGGVVYGAAMSEDCTSACHIKAESPDDLVALRGSKYIQSSTEGVYQQIKNELDNKRKVLFSGTPCQIAGLKSLLRTDYENLLCVGVICHGVPSSKIWRKYLRYRENRAGASARRTFFRHKYYGWKMFAVLFEFSNSTAYKQILYKDLFMQMFLQNICLRPSCYSCHFKGLHELADISLADFWGAENVCPELDDDKGLSLVLVHTPKGNELFQEIKGTMISKEVDFQQAALQNPAIFESCTEPINRDSFMNDMDTLTIKQLGAKYLKKKSIVLRIRIWISVNIKKRLQKALRKG